MARTSGMPIGTDVRDRLRVAQRAEADAIANVQKAVAAEADSRRRLDAVTLRHRAELLTAARAIHAAQAAVVRTSGIERAAVLLDVSPKILRSAVKEIAKETDKETSVQATNKETLAATTAPTIAPANT
jgi:hypothetical protein